MTEPESGPYVDQATAARITNLFTMPDAQYKQKIDDQKRLIPADVERSRIRKMIREWPDYVELHLQLTEHPEYFKLYGIPGLTIENITDSEKDIIAHDRKLASDLTFDMKKMSEISRIKTVFTKYITFNKIYRDNPVCPELTRSAINLSCYREFAMNEWQKLIENPNFRFSLETIITMLSKQPPSIDRPSDREPTRPMEQMLDKIDKYVSENLVVPRRGGQSISSRKSAKRHPRRKSSTTKRRPRRKSSAIKHRRRRTSRK